MTAKLSEVSSPAGLALGKRELDDFQDDLFRRFADSCVVLNFALTTAPTYERAVRNALADLGLEYLWQLNANAIRNYNILLIERGRKPRTRGSYCSSIRGVLEFMIQEHAVEIALTTGVQLIQPVTRRTAPKSRFCSSYAERSPPTLSLIRSISRRLREGIEQAGNFPVFARDVTTFELLYLSAMRANEALQLDLDDLHPKKGGSGQIHIRFGKGAKGSGPRPRWVPTVDGLRELLAWYVSTVRPKLMPDDGSRKNRALLVSASGERLDYESLAASLERCLKRANIRVGRRFTLHQLRHARATHLFESGMNLVAIQKLLGHQYVTTTQQYVHVDASFVAQAHKRMVQRILQHAGK